MRCLTLKKSIYDGRIFFINDEIRSILSENMLKAFNTGVISTNQMSADEYAYRLESLARAAGSATEETLYVNGEPFETIRRPLMTQRWETGRPEVLRENPDLNEVIELAANGDCTLEEAFAWCRQYGYSTYMFENAFKERVKRSIPTHTEDKRPWYYCLVEFLNNLIDMILSAIMEDFV